MKPSTQTVDCIVVGGGVIGLMTARELVNAGATVQLVERREIGQESSWAGGGILLPLFPWHFPDFLLKMALWSQKHYPSLVQELYCKTGIDSELIQSGMLVVLNSEELIALEWGKEHNYQIDLLESTAILNHLPVLNEQICKTGLWLPDILQVRNPLLVKALHQALVDEGVKIKSQSPVSKILVHRGRVQGVEVQNKQIKCEVVVIACGAWSSKLILDLPYSLNVDPIRGQMLLFKGPVGLFAPIVSGLGYYMIPRKDGRILVGSTIENVGFDKSTTPEAFDELKSAAFKLVPILNKYMIERHWAGLRPGSKDGIPTIGEVPNVKGLFVNTGHFRNGLLLAPASARLVVQLIQGCETLLDPSPYQFK